MVESFHVECTSNQFTVSKVSVIYLHAHNIALFSIYIKYNGGKNKQINGIKLDCSLGYINY